MRSVRKEADCTGVDILGLRSGMYEEEAMTRKKRLEAKRVEVTEGTKVPLFAVYLVDGAPRIEIASVPDEDPGSIGLVLADVIITHANLYKDLFNQDADEARTRIIEV